MKKQKLLKNIIENFQIITIAFSSHYSSLFLTHNYFAFFKITPHNFFFRWEESTLELLSSFCTMGNSKDDFPSAKDAQRCCLNRWTQHKVHRAWFKEIVFPLFPREIFSFSIQSSFTSATIYIIMWMHLMWSILQLAFNLFNAKVSNLWNLPFCEITMHIFMLG